jgi:uncharacterized membrane-anchored protein
MIKKALVIFVILCQVFVLAFMAGKRELISLTGKTVFLRTAPIDPRDIFRGDYVRLRYEISGIPFNKATPELLERFKKNRADTPVYAALNIGEDGIAEAVSLSLEKPQGLFIKGNFPSSGDSFSSGPGMAVKYGIESYFVQQGKGLDMEKMRGSRNAVQVPLEMEVALAEDGTAVIKNHRWSPIGLGIEMLRSTETRTAVPRRTSAKFRITFKNASTQPVVFVNLPGYCSLTLEPVAVDPEQTLQVPDKPFCAGLKPTANDVFVFQPDASGVVDIDLSEPEWRVFFREKSVEPGELDWQKRFRIVYHPPSPAACSHLENAKLIWHGRITTAAFHGRGNID